MEELKNSEFKTRGVLCSRIRGRQKYHSSIISSSKKYGWFYNDLHTYWKITCISNPIAHILDLSISPYMSRLMEVSTLGHVGIIYIILALSYILSTWLRFSLGNSVNVFFFWLDMHVAWLFSSSTCVFRLFTEFFFPRYQFVEFANCTIWVLSY